MKSANPRMLFWLGLRDRFSCDDLILKMPVARILGHAPVPVSYTHLTLPTTPYV